MHTDRRSGFTLVEILTAVALASAVWILLLSMFHHLTLLTIRSSNLMLAEERGRYALSVLEPRVLHASFGVLWESGSDRFQRSFGGKSSSFPPPALWLRGPLQIWQGLKPVSEIDGVSKGRALVVLYAVPSTFRAYIDHNRAISLSEGDPATIDLISPESPEIIRDRLNVGMERDLWSWVTFPCMKLPVHVVARSGARITVRLAEKSDLNATLMPYDEMHYLRGERFQVENETLYSESLRTAWVSSQPRVDGILEMWFNWVPSERLLDVWVLASGGPAAFGGSGRPATWPAEAPWRKSFERHDMKVLRASWLVRNL